MNILYIFFANQIKQENKSNDVFYFWLRGYIQQHKMASVTVFDYCDTETTTITIPNSVTDIDEWAFAWCRLLTSVNIPDSVITIGARAFYNCSALTSIAIPNNVVSINKWTFAGCDKLTSIKLPNTLTTIDEFAFMDCNKLMSIELPSSLTTIGKAVFYNCSGLLSIRIPFNVQTVDEDAYRNCNNVKSIIIESSTTKFLKSDEFEDCDSLEWAIASAFLFLPLKRHRYLTMYDYLRYELPIPESFSSHILQTHLPEELIRLVLNYYVLDMDIYFHYK